MSARRAVAPRLIGVAAALGALALIGLEIARGPANPTDPLLVRDTHGSVRIDNSRAGRALVKGPNLRPGEAVRGGAVIENTGSATVEVSLWSTDLDRAPSSEGGDLVDVLQLRVRERTPHNPRRGPRTLYEGGLAEMPPIELGKWRPGRLHEYTFRVQFPDSGPAESLTTGDNVYQGASADLTFMWTANEA
ncbi:MAG TPA: hypothetical protein VEK39_11050 [Solirubrobacterales bacterium]|nr:hypothetical protein [Solirubrobacterales bacterium]